MPGTRKYKPKRTESNQSQPNVLPVNRPIAVYYRQSSMAQVGNISTDMQQIDLPNYVISLGWQSSNIVLIDEDEGVSGATRIEERKGMSRLFEMITSCHLGAVAVQAEDRLFRDETQIQVNVFLEACVKNDVRVITPYFKYNFADKHEGPYHRLLFRMRAEQAADFLNSYVRGRLFAAKERMLMQGLWMGGNINLGYMVDDRKTLPSGIPNPNWRKYEPFEPCASIVVKIFETFIMLGGNQQATLRYLHNNGPHFPDFEDPSLMKKVPPGFSWAKPVRMKKRNGVYMVGSISLQNMLTNAVYQGHWIFRDCVVQWNNHPAIVPENLFYEAFNYLSPVSFDGTVNENYSPRLGRRHSTKKKKRHIDEPVYVGLVGTYQEDEWRSATASWRKNMGAYAYTCNYSDYADIQQHMWSRRSDYFDDVITQLLHEKLRATFNSEVWNSVLSSTTNDFDRECRQLQQKLEAIEDKIQTLVNNFSVVKSQRLLETLEAEFSNYERDKESTKRKIEKLKERASKQDSLIRLAKQAETVLSSWDKMGIMEKQGVAKLFIERVVVAKPNDERVVNVKIHWNDGSTNEFTLPYRSKTWILWKPEEVEALKKVLEGEHVTQVDICSALPKRNWRAIRIKTLEVLNVKSYTISPKPIRDSETYENYIDRIERGDNPINTWGNRWTEEEVTALKEALDNRATQLEIAAALPVRTWEAIRKKIRQLRGKGVTVPETGYLSNQQRIGDYLNQNSETAGSMSLPILGYSSPQRLMRMPLH